MLSMAEMRAKLLEARQGNNANGERSGSKFFQFSKMAEGSSVRIRFVEDADANNQFFWRTRAVRSLKFSGLTHGGQFYEGDIYVDIPAFNLKKNEVDNTLPADRAFTSAEDPIQQKIQNLWNEGEAGQETYRKFKRRSACVYRGFVREEGAETKMTYFIMSSQIQPKIEKAISDPEQIEAFPELPVDPTNGRDFILKCVNKDGRRNYEMSDWSLKTSPLTPDELTVMQNDLDPLYNLLPKKPDLKQLEAMEQIYDAIVADEPFDYDKWGKIFKPNNVFEDSDGKIQIRTGNTGASSSDDVAEAAPVATTAPSFAVSQPPAQITTQEVNSAIKENTTTVNASNVGDMVANLMAQFNNVNQ